ncbi:MAG TPA: esterase-like activity of phytase family protein [Caulobacteraceae bacterium]|jgi:hypothetical protein
MRRTSAAAGLVAALVLAVVLALHVQPGRPARAASPPQPQSIELRSQALPLDPRSPSTQSVGALTYVWGAHLTAAGSSRFGGLSGLEAEPLRSGYAFTAVTDDGDMVRWTSPGAEPPSGPAVLRPLLDPAGRPPGSKPARDAEDIARDAGGYLVSFEQRHRVWRYPGEGVRAFGRAAQAAGFALPPTEGMAPNEGFEGLAVFSGPGPRRLAVGSEDGRVWSCTAQACSLILEGAPEFGYRLTALEALEGTGDLVAVYRFFNPLTKGLRAIIAYLPVEGGRARIVPLARLSSPHPIDNMEAIAAVRQGDGWRLFLLSDDNFSPDQRTLMLAFDWRSKAKGPASPPAPRQIRRR